MMLVQLLDPSLRHDTEEQVRFSSVFALALGGDLLYKAADLNRVQPVRILFKTRFGSGASFGWDDRSFCQTIVQGQLD